jgi:hypothetical protein
MPEGEKSALQKKVEPATSAGLSPGEAIEENLSRVGPVLNRI